MNRWEKEMIPLVATFDGQFAVGRGEVRGIYTPRDRKAEFLLMEDETCYVRLKTAFSDPVLYPLPAAEFQPRAKAVLMDLDGTSVISEEFWIWIIELTMKGVLKEGGFTLEEADIPFVSGFSVTEHLQYCIDKYRPEADIGEAREIYHRITRQEMQKILEGRGRMDGFHVRPWLKEFLLALKENGIKIGLVTSGLYEKAMPAIDSLYRSLCRWKTSNYFSPQFEGFANYVRLFSDKEFWSSFGTLLIFIIAGFLTMFAVNMPVTYLVYKLGASRAGKFFQRAFVIPMMVPGMVATMYWKFFFSNREGILNTILEYFHKAEWCKIWLADKSVTLWCLLLIGFPFVGGFGFLVLLSGFLNIDSALGEAAELDGANALQKFLRIDIPMILPQMKILSILGMISGIQAFQTQMIMTNGRYGTMVPGLLMYQTAFTKGNYGYASAMGVVLFVIILIMTILQNKYVKNADA